MSLLAQKSKTKSRYPGFQKSEFSTGFGGMWRVGEGMGSQFILAVGKKRDGSGQ